MKIMKKLFVSIIVMAFFAVIPASAQGIYFGVKGGVNNSKFNLDYVSTKSGYGWFVGPTLRIDILPCLGIQGAVFYNQANSKVNDVDIKQKSILVPIDARLNLPVSPKVGLFISTGPQFGFNTGDKDFNIFSSGDQYAQVKDNYNETFQLKKSMFSWNFGAGVMLTKHFELGIVYTVAIAKTGELKNLKEGDKAKSKGWMASGTIYF